MDLDTNIMTDTQSAIANAIRLSKTYSSGDEFFACAPQAYQPYYLSVMKKNLQFYEGFVPGIHDNSDGIYSTHMASAICGGLANKTVGADIAFRMGSGEENRADLEYISHIWTKQVNFQTFARQAIEYAYATGISLIKLNSTDKGEQYPVAVRGDMFVFTEDAQGKLIDLKCLVKAYTSVDRKESYLLIEHRYLKPHADKYYWKNSDGQAFEFDVTKRFPYARYEVVSVLPGDANTTNNNVWKDEKKGLNWNDIPQDVRLAINKSYGCYKVNQEIRLPYKEDCLGAWTLKANGYDGTAPYMPFGKSILKDIWVELAEYDIYASFCDKDVNNGQGQVFTPKQYSIENLGSINNQIVGEFGQVMGADAYADTYRKVKNMQEIDGDPDKIKPFCNQFDLRAMEWEKLQDNCLRRMAAKLHMSPKVIASFLGKEVVEKTATEVVSDDDSTIEWVKIQRSIFKPKFDEMIEAVLSKDGRVGNVIVRFGSIGAKPRKTKLDELAIMLKYHLTTREEAMREIYEEMDENQLNALIRKSQEEADKEATLVPDIDELGGATYASESE